MTKIITWQASKENAAIFGDKTTHDVNVNVNYGEIVSQARARLASRERYKVIEHEPSAEDAELIDDDTSEPGE